MKQAADNKTLELAMPGAKRGRGRPTTGNAMSSAERQKAYRDRKREEKTASSFPVTRHRKFRTMDRHAGSSPSWIRHIKRWSCCGGKTPCCWKS
jgi:hypothetical protein